MNSQDKLGLTVCYRTDDEDDIGIYISEVSGLIFYNCRSKSKRVGLFFAFYVSTNLNSGSRRCLWKDADRFLRPLYHAPWSDVFT